MSEESSPDPKKTSNAGLAVVWLIVAFVPSLIALPMAKPMVNGNPPIPLGLLLVMGAGCCFGSAFGILRKVERPEQRIFLAAFLGIGFFVLNVIIVVFIGCSSMLGGLGPT